MKVKMNKGMTMYKLTADGLLKWCDGMKEGDKYVWRIPESDGVVTVEKSENTFDLTGLSCDELAVIVRALRATRNAYGNATQNFLGVLNCITGTLGIDGTANLNAVRDTLRNLTATPEEVTYAMSAL